MPSATQTLIILYASWMLMMITHECGHILHALVSGGHVTSVSIPLAGFSQTMIDPNPAPRFVVWGGPIWGVVIPIVVTVAWRAAHFRFFNVISFFCGFALIANGVYIGLGPWLRAGDSREMLRLGTSPVVMVSYGVLCVVSGLFLWHQSNATRDCPGPSLDCRG